MGEKDATTVAETTTLLEFRIPFITSGRKDFKVYRSHKAEGSETIDTLTTTAKDGEYIEVGNGYLIITRRSSPLMPVGYTEESRRRLPVVVLLPAAVIFHRQPAAA